ncbi:adenosine kinase [Litorimonas sp. RW-G-Af-16]|uniref:adenosine kinase n=1 Tax=Litorimonas sp. RW-G-Af-16 TaxID=3241168 RepID=UPI003AAF8044
METKYDVLGIGNAIMDVIAPVTDAFLTDHGMTKGAMTLVDQPRALTIHTSMRAASTPTEIAGGSAGNTMVGIAKMGVRAAYIGKVGKDETGEKLAAGFREAGLEFSTVPTESGTSSARSMIAVTPDGERTMNTFLGASVEFGHEDIKKSEIQAADVIYLEGYLFDSDAAKSAYVSASEIAKAAGRKVALTLSDSFCVDRHRASFQHLVEHHVDILFANEDELTALTGEADFDVSLAKLVRQNIVVCATRSHKGSTIMVGNERHDIPAVWVEKVVDTTGAGDQYAAGVLAGRAMGLSWSDAGYLGSLAARGSHFALRRKTPHVDP